MFEFGDGYRWCAQCSGNIRAGAYYCRFCGVAVGGRLLRNKRAENVTALFDRVSRFLDWEWVIGRIGDGLRERILEEEQRGEEKRKGQAEPAGVSEEEFRRRVRGFDSWTGEKLDEAGLGLLDDVLLNLHEQKVAIGEVCQTGRMRLIEVSVADVVAEWELRKVEEETGKRCEFCDEFVGKAEEQCRFCGGVFGGAKPRRVDPLARLQPFDEELLRRVVLWEVAWRKRHGEPNVDERIVDRCGVDAAAVSKEVEAQEAGQDKGNLRLPVSRWRERMEEFGVIPRAVEMEFLKLHDLGVLVGAARREERLQEAILVVEHALERWQESPKYRDMVFSFRQQLAGIHMARGDFEKYHEEKSAARETMPENLRELLKDSDRRTERIIARIGESDPKQAETEDPMERFEKQQKIYEETVRQAQETMERMEKLAPGLGGVVRNIHNNLRGNAMDVARLTAEAQSLRLKGELTTALQRFDQALEMLDETSVLDSIRRGAIIREIAATHQKSGNMEDAERYYLKAIENGNDLAEAQSSEFELSSALFAYAKFLSDQGRLTEAKSSIEAAIKAQERCVAEDRPFKLKPEAFAETFLKLKEQYATILGALGEVDSQHRVLEEVERLAETAEKFNADRKYNRRAFLEGLPSADFDKNKDQ